MVCRLSSVTSVPYKQFSWGKTIIIHYFHRDGQLTDIFTPQHPGDLMKHNEALSLLLVSFHRIFTRRFTVWKHSCALKKQRRQRAPKLWQEDKRPAWAGTVGEGVLFLQISQPEPGFHCTDFSSPSDPKHQKQMFVLKKRVTDMMRWSQKGNFRFLSKQMLRWFWEPDNSAKLKVSWSSAVALCCFLLPVFFRLFFGFSEQVWQNSFIAVSQQGK